jgi:DNA processing protein
LCEKNGIATKQSNTNKKMGRIFVHKSFNKKDKIKKLNRLKNNRVRNLDELHYQIAVTCIEGIGDVSIKSLLAYCGNPQTIFETKKGQLLKIPGIGHTLAKSLVTNTKAALKLAEKEIEFIQKHKIVPLFCTDKEYPHRLKYCVDSPVMLYYKGNVDLNASRIVSIVGTRSPSEEGLNLTTQLIDELAQSNILVVSGLAYGIDVAAHKQCLTNALPTVGVLAHGLDRIYPSAHDRIAKKMINCGGLLTEFMSNTNPDAVNFPKRNRIVAGMVDALVVVESKRTGGSLITATIAQTYNKDVFAFPGRAGDELSEGPNGLIKHNKASLIENANDLLFAMNWIDESPIKKKKVQTALAFALNEDETRLMECFKLKPEMHLDELSHRSDLTISKVAALLLNLEFKHVVKSLPGKMYKWIA